MDSAVIHNMLRSRAMRAVIASLDDTGGDQTVSVTGLTGHERSAVPVHFPFGFSSHVPLDGAVTHVVTAGGDPSDLVALPPANPSVARMGGLSEGETVLYDAVGQAVYLQGGRVVRIDARTSLDVYIAGNAVMSVTKDGVSVGGDLSVSGSVRAQGDVKAGSVSLTGHTHGGVQSGSSRTSPPG